MMPLRQNRGRVATAQGASIPAPVGGWNARDPQDGMDKKDAIELENWFPQAGYVELRGGMSEHASGVGAGNVETVMSYEGATKVRLLAASSTNIYNATTAGTATSLASSLSSGRWQWTNFNNHLLMVNGADTPRKYDGSAVSTATYTGSGLTPANLIDVMEFKGRLFFVEKDTQSFWYGSINSLTGALAEFDLSFVGNFGGSLLTMGTWTRDGGNGQDDLFCAIMTSGEVIVYEGSDPSDSTAWSKVGTYRMGRPVGRRAVTKYGADLVVATEDGYMPLSAVLPTGATRSDLAISDKIRGAVNEAIGSYGSNFGWQMTLYPKGQKLIVNVPVVASSEFEQHVMNTQTGAWCLFTGWDSHCYTVHDGDLYFGGASGKVYLADTGTADGSTDIIGDAKTSFQYFGGRGLLKKFNMIRPIMSSDGDLPLAAALNVDFEDTTPTLVPSTVESTGTEWDAGTWDDFDWAGGLNITKQWISVQGLGYSAAVKVRTQTGAQQIRWYSTDVLFEKGGFI